MLASSPNDRATIVAAGITVHEALAASEALLEQGIAVRVIDAYSVRPLDEETLVRAASETKSVVVVEDHWIDGGLGDALAALVSCHAPHSRVRKLGVTRRPRSGTKRQLLEYAGIDRGAIAEAVREIVARAPIVTPTEETASTRSR